MRNRKFQPAIDVLPSRIAPGDVMVSPMCPVSGLDYDKALVSPLDPLASPPADQPTSSPSYGPGDYMPPNAFAVLV